MFPQNDRSNTMTDVPKRKRPRRTSLSRAKKLAQLGQFSKKPAEVLMEQCPTRCRLTFHVYHWDRQAYFPLPAVTMKLLIRNKREFARLRKMIADLIEGGAFQDEKNEREPEPPSLENQLDPALHRNQSRSLGRDQQDR